MPDAQQPEPHGEAADSPEPLSVPLDLRLLEEHARQTVGDVAYDYFAGGADDEITLADNVTAWSRYRLRPHVLRDVSATTTATTVLGQRVAVPMLVAPMAYQRMAHPDGEIATVRGAASAGTLTVVSTMATATLEEVAAAAPAPAPWFQLYVHRDRGLTLELVRRAEAAGYAALVVTVDAPVLGLRRRDERNRFRLPPGVVPANLEGYAVEEQAGSEAAAYAATAFQPGVTPRDLEWLREQARLPIAVKGVLRGDDALCCADAGAAAVMVSNHGARQLDTSVATADVLAEVVDAVGERVEVYVDGGIRRGTDVVKALALGARAVLVGRPVLWALATGGEGGVATLLEQLGVEVVRAMTLCGAAGVGDLGRDLLA